MARSDFDLLRGQTIDRLEVGGEVFVTTRFASSAIQLSYSQSRNLARTVWPAVKFGSCYLIDHFAVESYDAQSRGNEVKPLSKESRGFYWPQEEILVTRPGVISTLAHLFRSFDIHTNAVPFFEAGLIARRVGNETIVYEDDWWEFVKNEWERPRLKFPTALPKPDGVVPGDRIPSPLLGLPREEISKGKFLGWTAEYAALLDAGDLPPLRTPRSERAAARHNLPMARRVRKRRTNPHGPIQVVDRLDLDRENYVTAERVALMLGTTVNRAIRIIAEDFPRFKIGRHVLVPERYIWHWIENIRSQRIGYRDKISKDELVARPGTVVSVNSLVERSGIAKITIQKAIKRGLPIQRLGKNDYVIFEDDFEDYFGVTLPVPSAKSAEL